MTGVSNHIEALAEKRPRINQDSPRVPADRSAFERFRRRGYLAEGYLLDRGRVKEKSWDLGGEMRSGRDCMLRDG